MTLPVRQITSRIGAGIATAHPAVPGTTRVLTVDGGTSQFSEWHDDVSHYPRILEAAA
ncbi:MAG: hypothetical protein ABSF03_06235 [Streptosporangiaceae bacterium]